MEILHDFSTSWNSLDDFFKDPGGISKQLLIMKYLDKIGTGYSLLERILEWSVAFNSDYSDFSDFFNTEFVTKKDVMRTLGTSFMGDAKISRETLTFIFKEYTIDNTVFKNVTDFEYLKRVAILSYVIGSINEDYFCQLIDSTPKVNEKVPQRFMTYRIIRYFDSDIVQERITRRVLLSIREGNPTAYRGILSILTENGINI